MFEEMLPQLAALAQVILIDLVLAGDNALVVGLAVAGVAREYRARVIFWGIAAAVVLRILFALVATQLLAIVGLTLAGGFLLLWVCWKLWRELRSQSNEAADGAATDDMAGDEAGDSRRNQGRTKTVRAAIGQVVLADLSMSLDNVLAVAGASHEHPWIMTLGLLLSVGLMGVAANYISRLLHRYPWIAYIGLAVIGYVALEMIWRGGGEVLHATALL